MIKEWFVLLQGKRYGPFSIFELKEKIFIRPETLVWKKDFPAWKKAEDVDELKILFKDDEPRKFPLKKKDDLTSQNKLAEILEMRWQPNPWLFWWLIALLIILYLIQEFFF